MTTQSTTRPTSIRPGKATRPLVGMILAIALVCSLVSAPALAAQSHPTADDVKAAYLFNFGKFVRYPPSPPTGDFDICLLGHDPVAQLLEHDALEEHVQDRQVRFKHYDKAADARSCAIVFMGASEALRIDKDLAALDGSNALTVSDIPRFVDHGGMIQFVLQDNKLRFAVNLSSATHARLALSSELLKVAVYVSPKPTQEAP